MPRAPRKSAAKKAAEAAAGPMIKSGGTRLRPLVEHPETDLIGVVAKKARPALQVNIHNRKSKPTYLRMIKQAIRANPANNIHGATAASISKYIRVNFPIILKGYNARLRVALARCVDNEELEKVGSNRFKITKKEREREARKAARAKKAKKEEEGEEGAEAPKKKRKAAPKKAKKEGEPKKEGKPKKPRSTPKKAKKEGEPKKRKAAPKKRQVPKEGAPAAPSGATKWVWQFKDGSWWNYDWEASDVIETVYQDYLKNPGQTDVRSVTSGQWDYMVDFRQMKQQNLGHSSHTKRDIRRVQLPVEEADPQSNPRAKSYPETM